MKRTKIGKTPKPMFLIHFLQGVSVFIFTMKDMKSMKKGRGAGALNPLHALHALRGVSWIYFYHEGHEEHEDWKKRRCAEYPFMLSMLFMVPNS